MILIKDDMCDYCGTCVSVCPVDCIELDEHDINVDNEICIDCSLCVNICPIEVLYQD